MKKKRQQHITKAELAVLEVLWDSEPCTARHITETIYTTTTSSDIATVQSLLRNLESKGFVTRDRRLHVHLFEAANREEVISDQIELIADKFTSGAIFPLLVSLVDNDRISEEEMEQLRSMIRKKNSEQ